MVFNFKLPFFSNSTTTNKSKAVVVVVDNDDDSLSTASTIAPSKPHSSAINSFFAAFSTEKYMNDPMRTTNHPDVVGYYYDPMSCGGRRGNVISAGYDCTNTGA